MPFLGAYYTEALTAIEKYLSYAHWLRTADPATLGRYDLRQVQAEREWAKANAKTAKALDKFIGKRLKLMRDMQSYGWLGYTMGTTFVITDRWGPIFHGYPEGNQLILSLRPEWFGISTSGKHNR